MAMKPIRYLYVWLCILPGARVTAQDSRSDNLPAQLGSGVAALSRAQAIQFAMAHSPLLGASRERITAARGNLQSAKALPPAEVNIGPSFGGDLGAVPLVSQTLEISGRRGARLGVARGELASTQREADTTRLDVIREVSRAYYDLAQAQQTFALFTDVAEIVQRTRDSVKLQVAKGTLPPQDLIKAETEVARAEADVARAQSEVTIRGISLNFAIGTDLGSSLSTSEPLAFVVVSSDQAALLVQAADQRPELAAAESRILAAAENVLLQRADLRPDLSVSLLQNTSVSSREFLSSRSGRIGVSLVFPLGDTGRIRGKVRQAEAQAREQEHLRDLTRLIVRRDVRTAFAQTNVTAALVVRYERDILSRADDLLKKAQFGYTHNATTLLEYLEAQRSHRDTHAEYLGILGDNARARAELERAVGAPVR